MRRVDLKTTFFVAFFRAQNQQPNVTHVAMHQSKKKTDEDGQTVFQRVKQVLREKKKTREQARKSSKFSFNLGARVRYAASQSPPTAAVVWVVSGRWGGREKRGGGVEVAYMQGGGFPPGRPPHGAGVHAAPPMRSAPPSQMMAGGSRAPSSTGTMYTGRQSHSRAPSEASAGGSEVGGGMWEKLR